MSDASTQAVQDPGERSGEPAGRREPLADLTVIVPVRNAAAMLEACLSSIVRSRPGALLVVDGLSTDGSWDIAARYATAMLSDEGRGLPVARMLGAQTATTRWVALIDSDVVLPDGALQHLFAEFCSDGYTALQAGLHSVGGPGYWGRALASHHRRGRSKNWFGVVATVMERDVLLKNSFDARFASGEDIELRWRLTRAGGRIGVSDKTIVLHRFAGDSFAFARSQWLMDGRGLGLMVRTGGPRAALLAVLPAAATVRGVVLSLLRLEPQWVPYYLCFGIYNYVGMLRPR